MLYYDGYIIQVLCEFEYKGEIFVSYAYEDGDYTSYGTCKKKDVQKWEDTWEYKQREKKRLENKEIEDKHDELVKKIKDEAMEQLMQRMKINIVFGKDGQLNEIALAIVGELRKIIDDKKI